MYVRNLNSRKVRNFVFELTVFFSYEAYVGLNNVSK